MNPDSSREASDAAAGLAVSADRDPQHAADQVVIAQMAEDGITARSTIANLHVALESARRIGPAIGIIMNAQKITEEEAFQVLRRASQNGHRKLRDVAEEVILTGTVQ